MTDVRATVTDAWLRLLDVPPSAGSDFFADGGHSLLAARFTARVGRELDIQLDQSLIFQRPEFESFCAAIQNCTVSAGGTVSGSTDLPAPPIEREDLSGSQHRFPLLAGQQSVLEKRKSAHRAGNAIAAFNLPTIDLALHPDLDLAQVRSALARVLRRQPALRLMIHADGTGEVIGAEAVQLHLSEVTAGDAASLTRSISESPFGPDEIPRLRVAIVNTGQYRYLTMCIDHLVADQVSAQILMSELRRCLENASATADDHVVAASRQRVLCRLGAEWASAPGQPRYAGALDYWREHADDMVPRSELIDPRSFVPNANAALRRSDPVTGVVPWSVVDQVARRAGTTAFAVLLAAVWCHAQDRRTREVVVTPIANRRDRDTFDLVAFLSHAVVRIPPRDRLQPADMLRYVRELLQRSAPHEWMPHARLISELAPRRYGRLRPHPWLVVDLDQNPWQAPIREHEESHWNNTIVRLQFLRCGNEIELTCLSGADTMTADEQAELVAGVLQALTRVTGEFSERPR